MNRVRIAWSWLVFTSLYHCRNRKIRQSISRFIWSITIVIFSEESCEAIKKNVHNKVTRAAEREKDRVLQRLQRNLVTLEQSFVELQQDPAQSPEFLLRVEKTIDLVRSVIASLEDGKINIFTATALLQTITELKGETR